LARADAIAPNRAADFKSSLTAFCSRVSALHVVADLNQQASSKTELAKVLESQGRERSALAEILREIFALFETKRPNHLRFAVADDSAKLVDTQCVSGIHQTCAPHGKQASEKRSEPEAVTVLAVRPEDQKGWSRRPSS
jgi:hypothetical protein